jgi:hypothetical protein
MLRIQLDMKVMKLIMLMAKTQHNILVILNIDFNIIGISHHLFPI